MTWVTKIILLFSSYGPLYLILFTLGCEASDKYRVYLLIFWGFASILSPTVLFWFIFVASRSASVVDFKISKIIKPMDDEVISYMTSYFPLLFKLETVDGIHSVAIGIFYVAILLILYRIERVYIQPYLQIIGWRMYSVEGSLALSANKRTIILLARDEPEVGAKIKIRQIGGKPRLYKWIVP